MKVLPERQPREMERTVSGPMDAGVVSTVSELLRQVFGSVIVRATAWSIRPSLVNSRFAGTDAGFPPDPASVEQ